VSLKAWIKKLIDKFFPGKGNFQIEKKDNGIVVNPECNSVNGDLLRIL